MNIRDFISQKTHSYVVQAYRKTPEYKVEQFLYRMLPPVFYRSGPDSSSLLDWRRLGHQDCTNQHIKSFDNQVKKDYNLIIHETEESIQNFNIGEIGSLQASKAFSSHKTNARYTDVADWGANMYHDNNLSGRDEEDFKKNIYYTEKREGFSDKRPVRVEHIDWLKRNVGFQTGGSHHIAMIIHQINNQNQEYRREVSLTRVSIDQKALGEFTDKYTAILTTSKVTGKSDYEMKYAIQEIFSREYATCLPLYQIYEQAWLHLIVIEKEKLDNEQQETLSYLLECSKQQGLHIDLDIAMKDTLSLCTTRPPLKNDNLSWA